MKYFLSKIVVTDEKTFSFVPPSSPSAGGTGAVFHICYDRSGDEELHGVDIPQDDVASVLFAQHPQCGVEQVDFAQVEERLKSSRFYTEINQEVDSKIRAKYSLGEELGIMKMTKTSTEYVAMKEYIDALRAGGDAQKVAMGLKVV